MRRINDWWRIDWSYTNIWNTACSDTACFYNEEAFKAFLQGLVNQAKNQDAFNLQYVVSRCKGYCQN